MRTLRFILVFCLFLIGFAFAEKPCQKIKDYIFENLSESGTLKQDTAGFVYIDIDDKYIHKLIDFIKDEGFEEPPYFSSPLGHGAHISVIYAQEARSNAIHSIDEEGKTIYFTVKECKIIHPSSWEGVESVYVLTVDIPILDKIRKKYGLAKPKYAYHITIGVKYVEEQQEAA